MQIFCSVHINWIMTKIWKEINTFICTRLARLTPISYPEYARSQVRCWAWLWRNGMKLSISLAGVRSITPIPEIPEYDVTKSKLHLFARFQIQVKCYIKSDWGFTHDLYTFVSCIMANTFCLFIYKLPIWCNKIFTSIQLR
jgi:hypothetical protein